ncbi:hypothetical protein EIN_169550 [Entamoeba invadens IP1]|uniref:Expansin-like EG45 domain-containing protein n=1 Tax=Entamoeba invadens IP1 TaxID=370355 RepID=A0A0A1TY93_ENTIV|nr:hypothetical protein EIN_169550 [Entamoeba invadens IP1]ELP84510.1 hypothetical protein EIN_169550 [Entamoeba invadens IP1]|eukprot:XP_004183856.1 hypothetical protein EIN_169550 [Entamoeba invadens IP1]
MLFILLTTISSAYLTPLSDCQAARITYYDSYSSENVRCQLGTANMDTLFRCAPNTAFLNKASQCGICYEAVGELGSVRFMVTDECPASSNSEHCSGDYTHFDMAANAFPSLCKSSLGICNITYRMVACDHTGNIQAKLKDGSGNGYIGAIFRNHVVGIKKVQISLGGNTHDLTRDESNQWEYNGILSLPITYLITSIDDDTVNLVINDYSTTTLHEAERNFKIPQDTFFDISTLQKTTKTSSQECCQMPEYNTVYTDRFETPFLFLTGGTKNECDSNKYEGSCAVSVKIAQWGYFKITTGDHQLYAKSIKAVTFYAKATKASNLDLWAETVSGFKKTISMTTNFQMYTINLSEMGVKESDQYWYGIQFQNTDPSEVTYYLDAIILVYDDEVCTEKCSDHTSTCKTIVESSDDTSSAQKSSQPDESSSSEGKESNAMSSDNTQSSEESSNNSGESSGKPSGESSESKESSDKPGVISSDNTPSGGESGNNEESKVPGQDGSISIFCLTAAFICVVVLV